MTPDLAIVHGTALLATTDADDGTPTEFQTDTTIEITDGVITRIAHDPSGTSHAREVVDARGAVVMPGLINTHCHAAMTFYRGAAEDVVVDSWFNDYIWPMEVNVGAQDVYVGTLLAAAEMIRCGVTTVADHYFFMDEAARAITDSGMRANLGSAFFSSQGDAGLADSVAFAERWNGAADGRITTSIAPHAPYTVTDEHLRRAADEARRLSIKVHTHAAEDIAQTHRSLADRGLTPMQVLEQTGVLDAGCIIAHGNGILPAGDGSDIEILGRHADRVGVTHGPKGYLKFALGPITPIRDLRSVGVPVGYCTDGAGSNNTLDILESMRVTAISQKHVVGDPTWFRSATALHMAGPWSAAVLGLGNTIGRLAEGLRADIVVVDVSGPHCLPVHDLAATLVYSVQPSDVRTTIVDGRVLMRDREMLTIDLAALSADFGARARSITDRSHGRTIQDYDAR